MMAMRSLFYHLSPEDKQMLSPEESKRYARHISLSQVGIEGQEKLKSAKVLIVGAGGLGCPAAQYLAAAGVGEIGLIDHDHVDVSNLQRQVLFGDEDINKPKVEVVKRRLNEANPLIKCDTYFERLGTKNALEIFKKYDVVVDGVDNFQTKYLINDACIFTDKPMVSGAIYKFQGQLSTFNYRNGPSYRCLFPDRKAEEASCEEVGVLGVLPGIIGTMQAAEVMKIILEVGNVLAGKLKVIDTLTMEDQVINFEKDQAQIDQVKAEGVVSTIINSELLQIKSQVLHLDVRASTELPRLASRQLLEIPTNQLSSRYVEIPMNEEVVVCCQSGKRSLKAIEYLRDNFGFENLSNLEGGVNKLNE